MSFKKEKVDKITLANGAKLPTDMAKKAYKDGHLDFVHIIDGKEKLK